jgi:hypothetical protein
MNTARWQMDSREKQVLLWLCSELGKIGVTMAGRRLSARSREDVAQMVSECGAPAHYEIVEALRDAKASGLQMNGDLIKLQTLPAIQAAITEASQ